jgi:hypothetical protein
LSLALLITATCPAADLSGQLKLGYIYLDDDGNRSVDRSTFNLYEGASLSLERFRYRFGDNWRLNANLRNLTLNNRNLSIGLDRPGLFGVSLDHHKYRRVYSFAGDHATKRDATGISAWFYPHEYVKLFASGSYMQKRGEQVPLFDVTSRPEPTSFDYAQTKLRGGVQFDYQGRSLRAEYRAVDYQDELNTARDQQRSLVQLRGYVPLPRLERVIVNGGFQHFESKYTDSDFTFSANTVWAGGLADLPHGFWLRYHFKFDRASSDSDLIATDNISNLGYVGYEIPGLLRASIGYQDHINDDFEDEIRGSSLFASGWLQPLPFLELKGEYGDRSEDIEDGERLLGEQDQMRHRYSLRLKNKDWGSLSLHGESLERENQQLGSEVDFDRYSADMLLLGSDRLRFDLPILKWIQLIHVSGGYSYAEGLYTNNTSEFEFVSHTVTGAIWLSVADKARLGHTLVYYRSEEDLDVESFRLRFEGEVELTAGFGLEAVYRVHNFDNLTRPVLPYDQYYTTNIVELNLTKSLSR